MVADVRPTNGSLDAPPSEPTDTSEPVPGDEAATPRQQAARPAIDSARQPLARLAARWPHIEAEVVRRHALARHRR